MAEPWHRASPEGHSAAPRHLWLFTLVTTLCSAPAQYPILLLHPVSSSLCPFLPSSCLSDPPLTLLHLRRRPASASSHPGCPSLCTPLAPGSWRFPVPLLPGPTRRHRTTAPAAIALAASEPWALSPSPKDSQGSTPGAPLPASSSTAPHSSPAPFPWASLPCQPGRCRGGSPSSPAFPLSSPPTSRSGPAPPLPPPSTPRLSRVPSTPAAAHTAAAAGLRVPVRWRPLSARAGRPRCPLSLPCPSLLPPAPLPPFLPRLLFLFPGPFP